MPRILSEFREHGLSKIQEFTCANYSERRKFTRSCWFCELRLLKLVTLWFASDAGYVLFPRL